MAIQYDYFKNPPQAGSENKTLLHPRPVVLGTLKTEDLAKNISNRSSFSSADLKGILDNLAQELYRGLSESYNVYIEGIGTFSLSLESRPVEDAREIRSPSIRVKDIHFRPDKHFKRRFGGVTIKRAKRPVKRVHYPAEERYFRIEWYVNRYGSINITTVMKFNHCTHATAGNDLNYMVENGLLKCFKSGRSTIYTH